MSPLRRGLGGCSFGYGIHHTMLFMGAQANGTSPYPLHKGDLKNLWRKFYLYASFNCFIACSNTLRGLATFSRMKPSPSSPKATPLFSAK